MNNEQKDILILRHEPKCEQIVFSPFPRHTHIITFVAKIIVKMSPLLKGKSCSVVPLKLYLATHSVPCGHEF